MFDICLGGQSFSELRNKVKCSVFSKKNVLFYKLIMYIRTGSSYHGVAPGGIEIHQRYAAS